MARAPARLLRPRRADDLGLRRALSDRLLPLLVAAMTFLAALALAGAEAATRLADHWHTGAAQLMMVQVPRPQVAGAGLTRAAAVAEVLRVTPGVVYARRLPPQEITALLQPWLGQDPVQIALPLPGVFEVRLTAPGAAAASSGLDAALSRVAPGTTVERSSAWLNRLADLVNSLRACAALALLVVGFVATAVVAVATRAGLAARRDAIEIVHGLGASDAVIAGQFAARVAVLALAGALLGVLLSLPVLLSLATLAAPFQPQTASPVPTGAAALLGVLPIPLWLGLAALPAAAACSGWLAAQATVRSWLARLP